jgi:hypothetical protein
MLAMATCDTRLRGSVERPRSPITSHMNACLLLVGRVCDRRGESEGSSWSEASREPSPEQPAPHIVRAYMLLSSLVSGHRAFLWLHFPPHPVLARTSSSA